MNKDDVQAAFGIILDKIEAVIEELAHESSDAAKSRHSKDVEKLGRVSSELSIVRTQVAELQEEWMKSFSENTRSKSKAKPVEQPTLMEVDSPLFLSSLPPRNSPHPVTRGQGAGLRITFNETGKVVEKNLALETFLEAITIFGVEKVRALNLVTRNTSLIATKKSESYRQQKLGKYFVFTNTSTSDKKTLLETIAQQLGVEVQVEIV